MQNVRPLQSPQSKPLSPVSMIIPMLSKLTDHLPSTGSYLYEIKLDGQRTIAEVTKRSTLLYTRNLRNVTRKYPELTGLPDCLRCKSATLDGEIVALKDGIPSFELLQHRMSLSDARMIAAAAQQIPVLYYVFDLVELDGRSILRMPLQERKRLLARSIRPGEVVKLLPSFDSRDITLRKARAFGYEGVVAKKLDSLYYPGQRTDLWLKQKFQESDSFVIGGWLEGGRSHNFGSLLIGKYQGKNLMFRGRAGTGFNASTISMLMDSFEKLKRAKSPFIDLPKGPKGTHWLKPKLVADIKFKEVTSAGILRSPVYLGLRPDLRPQDCVL